MINQDAYDDLLPWQKAFVKREAINICRENKAYRMLEDIADGDDIEAAVHADEVMHTLYERAVDEVLEDTEFMDSISMDDEDRFMTRGNSHVR